MTRPRTIVLFERLYLLTLFIGAVHTAVQWTTLVARASPAVVLLTQFFTFGLTLLLVLLVSRRQSGIARIVLMAAFAIGLPVVGSLFAEGTYGAGIWIIIVQVMLQIVALGLLFAPPSRAWISGTWMASAEDDAAS